MSALEFVGVTDGPSELGWQSGSPSIRISRAGLRLTRSESPPVTVSTGRPAAEEPPPDG